jgi:MFS family permease
MKAEKAGEYAFLVCVIIAVLAGLAYPYISATMQGYVAALLVVLGAIVGLTTVTEKETTPFLVAAIALVATGAAGVGFALFPLIGPFIDAIVRNIALFVAPAAIIVALKAVYALASKK